MIQESPNIEPTRNKSPATQVLYRRSLIGLIVLFFLFWFVIPLFVPGLSATIYLITMPFRNLGIFVHEMGHGLFTVLSGGNFHWFQMELMRGGVAVTSGGIRLLTLLGGLLGPALAGALLLLASTRVRNLRWVLGTLIAFFVLGTYYILKPVFLSVEANPLLAEWSPGLLLGAIVPVTGGAITLLCLRLNEVYQRLYLQIVGILMCYAGFSDTSYIFMYEPLGNGMYSDARVVASLFWSSPENVSRLWFVVTAAGISALNFGLMLWGTWRALKK